MVSYEKKGKRDSVLITLMVFQLTMTPSMLVEATVQAARIKDGATKDQIAVY